MTKLKWQFFLFAAFLFTIMGFFASKALLQIRDQETQTYQRIAESVYNQFQARISDFLIEEDKRAFTDYQFVGKTSELSEEQKERGFLGYFQINPNGKFKSQFTEMPDLAELALDKIQKIKTAPGRKKQIEKHQALESIASNLQQQAPTSSVAKGKFDYVQLNAPNTEEKSADGYADRAASGESKKSSYPNPFRKFQSKSATKEADATTADSVAQSPGLLSGAQIKTYDLGLELAPMTDPFQARLIADKYLLFYRKAWFQNQIYQQGFAIDLKTFGEWLLAQSYDDTLLPEFTMGSLNVNGTPLFQFGRPLSSLPDTKVLFARKMGYPLSLLDWRLLYRHIPASSAERMLMGLTSLAFLTVLVALVFIYRSVATQMRLALKKEDFVSAVSHELKSPLTSIRLSSELLHQGWVSEPEKVKSHYKMLLKESSRLTRLIENVLSVSRLEKKKYQLALQKRDPAADFAEIDKELQTLVEQDGFRWQSFCDADLPPITCDPDALKQILYNLVENSLKFSKEASEKSIEMRLMRQNKTLVWQIRDHGPGIPERELQKIFDKFYRVENELTRKTKGCGIGLSLVKTLAEEMGAGISAQNHPEGGLVMQVEFLTQI